VKIERIPAPHRGSFKRGPYFAVRSSKQTVLILREGGPVMADAHEERAGRSHHPLSVRFRKVKSGLVLTACAATVPVGPSMSAPAGMTQMQALADFLWQCGY
jgi:hypothetical protein